ncbi:MAG: hypothetical protein ACK5PP_02740 [Acidimicrobiales bacterium]
MLRGFDRNVEPGPIPWAAVACCSRLGVNISAAASEAVAVAVRAALINCGGLHVIDQWMLTRQVGSVGEAALRRVCVALSYALGC